MNISFRFRPRLLDHLGGYSRQDLTHDISAGITVGIVALPLAMAFAIASGLPPQAGLFTAIVAGFLISAFGGSSVQIGGPAGAFIVVVFSIVERYGVANLMISTICAGVVMILIGMLRWGGLIRLIPVSIVIGFTNGIAVLIGLSQVKDFLGLQVENMPAEFFHKMAVIMQSLHTADPTTIALSVTALATVVFWPKSYAGHDSLFGRLIARLPGTLVALAMGTLAVTLLDLQVVTIGSAFGEIPQGLPPFTVPEFNWDTVRYLFAPILTIAFLGAVESLLCARVADSMTKSKHDPNQELVAQGIANIAAPLFGGFCATGTVARTVTNIRAGGRTPVAGMVHALTLLVIMLGAAPLASNVPLATLSGILMFVAWNMGEWREFIRLKNFSYAYRTILIATFVLTVVTDVTVAVEVGLVLACVFYITRMSTLTRVEPLTAQERTALGIAREDIEVVRVVGSLFFGAISKLEGIAEDHRLMPRVMVLDFSALIQLDTTGVEALTELYQRLKDHGAELRIAGASGQPLSVMERSGFVDKIGQTAFFKTLTEACDHHPG
ncbi:MAG: STAS domain-containing protein [Burkholderiaceae bacterium]|nr:STAS domain-containing protein [Burkholderiaceae bacterium]